MLSGYLTFENEKFEEKVNGLIEKGWEPQGGVQFDTKGGRLLQAMIKHIPIGFRS